MEKQYKLTKMVCQLSEYTGDSILFSKRKEKPPGKEKECKKLVKNLKSESYSNEMIRKNEKKVKEDRSLKQRQTSKEEREKE